MLHCLQSTGRRWSPCWRTCWSSWRRRPRRTRRFTTRWRAGARPTTRRRPSRSPMLRRRSRTRKGGWYGWKPSSSSDFSIWVVRACPLVEIRQFPSEQFEATVSQSTVRSVFIIPNRKMSNRASQILKMWKLTVPYFICTIIAIRYRF